MSLPSFAPNHLSLSDHFNFSVLKCGLALCFPAYMTCFFFFFYKVYNFFSSFFLAKKTWIFTFWKLKKKEI